VLPDDDVNYADLDKKYPILVKTVVELGEWNSIKSKWIVGLNWPKH
jgi:hypothetical protein